MMNDMLPPPGQVPGLVAHAASGDQAAIVQQPKH
jgi:hypothetical protein